MLFGGIVMGNADFSSLLMRCIFNWMCWCAGDREGKSKSDVLILRVCVLMLSVFLNQFS